MIFIQSIDNGKGMTDALVTDVFEINVFNCASRASVVLFVVDDPDIDQLSFFKIIYPDIFITDIPYQVKISCRDGHTAFILRIVFILLENVDVAKNNILDRITKFQRCP
jgi:hypothetical protein